MTRPPRLDFDALVRRMVLDLNLARWFAEHGRQGTILNAIRLARTVPEDAAALDLLERWITHE
jgi:hypothetical protein